MGQKLQSTNCTLQSNREHGCTANVVTASSSAMNGSDWGLSTWRSMADLDADGYKRGVWTPEEDSLLIDLIGDTGAAPQPSDLAAISGLSSLL